MTQSKKTPKEKKATAIEVLMQKPFTFACGGEEFQLQTWTYEQQTEIIAEAIGHILNAGQNVEEIVKLQDTYKRNPLAAIPFIAKLFGPILSRVYSISLGKSHEWINQYITPAKNLELLTVLWKLNDLPELLKNLQDLIATVKTVGGGQ